MILEAVFLHRPNRFLGLVQLDGQQVQVHIGDPGRLKELLIPGAKVFLKPASNPGRKTAYDMVAVQHGDITVCIDSRQANALAGRVLSQGRLRGFEAVEKLRSEVQVRSSRLDFAFELNGQKWFLEVKSCTLVEDGLALFPDAPTSRGARHLRELMSLRQQGFGAGLLVVVQRPDARAFSPNQDTDPVFAQLFRQGLEAGIEARVITTSVHPGKGLEMIQEIPVL